MKGKSDLSMRAVVALLLIAILFSAALPPGRGLAAGTLTVTPFTWNITGLDSNSPAIGPHVFPVGARVCSSAATTNVLVSFVWDTANPYVNLRTGSLTSITIASLAAGACYDAYFEVDVTREAAAFDTTRRYHITATDSSGTGSTPTPRELYVEHLISQSRNGVTDIKLDGVSIPAGGSMSLLVGGTYAIQLVGGTATQGYNQFEAFVDFPNTIFQILSVSTTYSADNSPYVPNPSDKLYADACKWDSDPNSPNYRSCVGGDYKAGGSLVTTTYTVKILSGGGTSQTLNSLLYDFSGSSFHYNSDFVIARVANIIDPTNVSISKTFSPSTTTVNGVSALIITLTNPNLGTVSGYNFADNLPANMAVADPPAASTAGCGSPTFAPSTGAISIAFADGTLAANSTCVIKVNVTASAATTYTNTTQHLYVGTLDTGKTATANLTVSTTPPPPACTPGWTMAQWTFAEFTVNPPPFPAANTRAADVATAAISVGGSAPGSVTAEADTSTGLAALPSMLLYGWPKNGPITPSSFPYVQFAIDTSQYTSVQMQFNVLRKSNGPDSDAVYYSTDGASWNLVSAFAPTTGWAAYGPYLVAGASTTGVTYFRMYGFGANCTTKGCDLLVDDVTFRGCKVPLPPRLSKAFVTSPVAVNGVSRLTFTIINPNSIQLAGVTFQDDLPAGLLVATPPNAATTCTAGSLTQTGGGALVGGELSFKFTGGTVAANTTCTASVDVKATTAGPHQNVSGAISSPATGTNNTSDGYGSAFLTAVLPPSIAKQFAPNPILAGGKSTLTFVLANPNQNNVLSGVAFADTLPTSPGTMVVANPPNVSTTGCGTPTFAPAAGAGSVSFSGGTIAGGSTCTVKVDVTAPTAGTFNNTSGSVSTIISGQTVNGNTAAASLTANTAQPAIAILKQVSTSPSGPWTSYQALPAGASVYYRFTIENTGDVPLDPVSITDPTLAGTAVDPAGCTWTVPLPVASATQDPTEACVRGPVTAVLGLVQNTATSHGTYGGTVYDSTPSTAKYATTKLTLAKTVAEAHYYDVGDVLHYTYVVSNSGSAALAGPVTVSDNKATVTCPSLTTIGDLDLFFDAGEIATCSATYTVTEADVTAGLVMNTATGSLAGVTSGTAIATATYEAAPTSVRLKRFQAWPEGATIHVQWETSQEINNLGFNLYRSNTRTGPKVKLNRELIPTNVPPGSPVGAVYDWIDQYKIRSGRAYSYWLEDVDLYGHTTLHGPVRVRMP